MKWRKPLLCGAVALVFAAGCGEDDDGASTVALADSASVTNLQNGDLGIPTTVAVRDGIAWVAESQFDRYSAFDPMAGPPGAFRLVGIPLAGGSARQISLPENFYPEGVTASPGGQLFVGSVEDGSIQIVSPGSETAEPFVANLITNSALGMAVSRDGAVLWVCDSNPTGGGMADSALVGISIAERMPVAAHRLEKGPDGTALCNDVVVAESGALWFTESFNGRIYRVAPESVFDSGSAELWLESDLLAGAPFGVNGITLAGGRLFVVNSTSGTLYGIDPALENPGDGDLIPIALTEVSPEGAVLESELTLTGPDGVTRLSDGELLIVENGLNAPAGAGKRLVHVRLGGP